MKKTGSCCTPQCCDVQQVAESPTADTCAPWVTDSLNTEVGNVAQIATKLDGADHLGAIKVRWGINRDNYKITPGLYAVGRPGEKSPVLATANYKLTFDSLRKELAGHDLWLLVLDTKGINVWCAAGKGTFGTTELINKINSTCLKTLVSHRQIILPQLGAPGVAAYKVKRVTGFKVVYGPVYARDLPRFLANELNATAEMRKVHFTLAERLAVVPVELNHIPKFLPLIFALMFIFNLISPNPIIWLQVLVQTGYNLLAYLGAIALGTFGIAALLPLLPFRSFAAKGTLLGLAWATFVFRYPHIFRFEENPSVLTAHLLFLTALTAFLALNFTGSTTYTSVSGVQKETFYTAPLVVLATLIGLGMAIAYKVMLFKG